MEGLRNKKYDIYEKQIAKLQSKSFLISLITLNLSGLNFLIKGQRYNQNISQLQKTPLKSKDTNRLKVKKLKKTFHANSIGRELGRLNNLDKINLVSKSVNKRQGHYILIKVTALRRYSSYNHIYLVCNNRAPKFMKQKLIIVEKRFYNNS